MAPPNASTEANPVEPAGNKKCCTQCRREWDNPDHYWAHMLLHHDCCAHCHQVFGSASGLRLHEKQLHPHDQEILCKCGVVFNRAGALIAHLSSSECPGVKSELKARRLVQGNLSNREEVSFTRDGSMNGTWVVDSEDGDEDLMSFEHPESPAFSQHSEQSYQSTFIETEANVENGKSKSSWASGSSTPTQKTSAQGAWGPGAEDSRPQQDSWGFNVSSTQKATLREFGTLEKVEFSKEQIMARLAEQRKAAEERDGANLFHPSHPRFRASDHWNPVLRHYKCPYGRCSKTKAHLETFIQHLVSPAHGDDQIFCTPCGRYYGSPTAYTQHFESLSKGCTARDVSGAAISEATGGLIKVVGENEDGANKYSAWVEEVDHENVAAAVFEKLKENEARAKARAQWSEERGW